MSIVRTSDGADIFFKDWGPRDAQPIVFHHGWPLSSDDWDTQMLFFLQHGYRVVAHDRRGHGRSSQIGTGHDMDHYAADASAVAEHLDLRNAVHIGHSTGGGEVARYVAKFGQPQGRVAKAVLVSAVPPLMLKTPNNPGGTDISVFDGFRTALAANRAGFFLDVAAGPFYGFNRPGADVSDAVIRNWWRQGMMGSALAHYEGIKAFSETDQTQDLKAITVPTLVLQGDDDQVVPYADASLLQVKLLQNGTLKIYPGFPHGMLTTHADVINPDLWHSCEADQRSAASNRRRSFSQPSQRTRTTWAKQAMASQANRAHQMFPALDAAQIASARRFRSGPERRFAPGEEIYAIGAQGAPAWLVLQGTIEVVRRDGLSHLAPITTHGVGQFSGEVNQLAGRPSIAAGRAGPEGCTALPFDAAHLRALMVGSADLGETVMRALILRRVDLIAEGGAGTILLGDPNSADILRLQSFLTRSGYPNLVLDAASDAEGKALVERMGVLPEDLPLVVCPDGNMLRRPSDVEVAACLGMTPALDPATIYDVAIVGAGPAGLAAAVYAASEGLTAIVLDERVMGGQAGASARIENYLGFPTGISGQALAGRAFNQALKFGAEIAVPVGVDRLDCSGPRPALQLVGDRRLQARTIVIASGARYRRPGIPDLARYEGHGVSYWASPIEARTCAGETIALVGGGNSAGQAVVFLAPQVKRLHLFVRRDLSETMSRYLIDRIASLPNVEIHVSSEVVALRGDDRGVTSTSIRNRDGVLRELAIRHLFLFIGADPNSSWLDGCVANKMARIVWALMAHGGSYRAPAAVV